jgi:hypothetical protein
MLAEIQVLCGSSERERALRLVRVFRTHPQPPHCVALEVELDHNGRLISDHPAVMARLDRDRLRRGEHHRASVGVLNMDLPVRQEPDMHWHRSSRLSPSFLATSGIPAGRSRSTPDSRTAERRQQERELRVRNRVPVPHEAGGTQRQPAKGIRTRSRCRRSARVCGLSAPTCRRRFTRSGWRSIQ